MLDPALPTTSWSAFIIAFLTPESGVFEPVISSAKIVNCDCPVENQEAILYGLTCNERVDSGSQSNQDTQSLGGSVTQSFARRICKASGKRPLQLRQERLDSKRDLLQ